MARPREADRIDIPARAVDAAIGLFAEAGVAAITLAAIAERVGCRPPALYRYFRNKEALLLAVHDEGFRRMYAYKREAVETATDPMDRLRRGGLAYLRFAFDHPHLYRLMFDADDPRRARAAGDNPFRRDLGMRALDILKSSVQGCQQAGYLAGFDADDVAFFLWSMVHGVASLGLQQRTPHTGNADLEELAATAIKTAMALIGATRR